MEKNLQKPPPLVPKTTLGWLLPLTRAALAALALAWCYALHASFRQGRQLSDTPVR